MADVLSMIKSSSLIFVFVLFKGLECFNLIKHFGEGSSKDYYWFNILFMGILIVLGGIFAGLTIGLMALDERSLELISKCGNESDRADANKILPIRRDGYLLLVSLLLANTIINETLPIVADQILGNGWIAILVSTLLLLVFAELIPQAACTRYGLSIGARFIFIVRILVFLFYPIAYPTARILEKMLGKHEPRLFKRSELKEIVSMMGESRLEVEIFPEEVSMIHGVLDLREKKAKDVMIPLSEAYMISHDALLDEKKLEELRETGFSRIPVFHETRTQILGMLLIKKLLMIDPKQKVSVKDLSLCPIPRFSVDNPLFMIFNELKLGRSHMAIIENNITGKSGPVGLLTLEDLIEALVQQEIIDETDEPLFIGKRGLVPVSRQTSVQGFLAKDYQILNKGGGGGGSAASSDNDRENSVLVLKHKKEFK